MVLLTDDELIAQFVETFCKLDGDCWTTLRDPPPDELNAGSDLDPENWDRILWRPARIEATRDDLQALYYRLSAKFPPLYERLIVSWRWLEVYLYRIRLLANPPGPELKGLGDNILRDPVFVEYLESKGYVPFAFDGSSYNPVCFDTNHRRSDGDCPIIAFEHEAMLSFHRIGASWKLWDSFRDLMDGTIETRRVK
jgi:hypothetical protein